MLITDRYKNVLSHIEWVVMISDCYYYGIKKRKEVVDVDKNSLFQGGRITEEEMQGTLFDLIV